MMRVGLGFDVHAFGGDRPLVVGGVEIPDHPGLVGHSDADVIAHAVADSLLGATGFPDLGEMFPASDDRYAGVSSLALLSEVAAKVGKAGWWVNNVDVVIAAERPQLAPHIPAMVEQIVATLGAVREPLGLGVHVSITPKRGEGLGFVGRAEGIAAWAVSMLQKS